MTVTDPSALVVKGLSVRYGGFVAVDSVSFELPRGDVHALIGPNGAGKTSCFNAICGNIRPWRGTVAVHGRAVAPGKPLAAWKAGIARTFQKAELFWTLTVREHMDLARRLALRRGLSPPGTEELGELLGLEHLQEQTVANLPLGTSRLVEFARAVATGANLILMDEPCSGLDQRETEQLKASLRRIQRDLGLSLLIVEHDMQFILSMASSVIVMDSGSVIATGTPNAIRQSAEVRRAYLGSADSESTNAIDVPVSSDTNSSESFRYG
jgi:ABC-type branched-subunit amino acid transport system ATPase component